MTKCMIIKQPIIQIIKAANEDSERDILVLKSPINFLLRPSKADLI